LWDPDRHEEHIRYANPSTPLSAGFTDIGGYTLAFVTNAAYANERIVQVYWAGVRYSLLPTLDQTAAYYGTHQNSYASGREAGCATTVSSACRGSLDALSIDADYHFTWHFDGYVGALHSAVHDGLASGYNFYTNNLNPTIGIRYKF
jgi:hypothetical protein